MKQKIPNQSHKKRKKYKQKRWNLLKKQRKESLKSMRKIKRLSPRIYGSIARGDINQDSDIDIIIPHKVPSYKLETKLDYQKRRIVQATPGSLIKGHIIIEPGIEVVFPLVDSKGNEMDFYKFGGQLTHQGLENDHMKRVPGVDKRLVLIEPKEEGHLEKSILGEEGRVAKKLGISIEMVKERIRVLRRRQEVGRTGVYLSRELAPEESFEDLLRSLAKNDSNIRRL